MMKMKSFKNALEFIARNWILFDFFFIRSFALLLFDKLARFALPHCRSDLENDEMAS